MTLEQLRIFVAVAEREHVTRAARDLNLTQSAVSAAVSALEARHATRLFHRVGRGIALTEAGRVFLAEARAVLARAAAAELALQDLAGLQRGALSLHASQTIANYWLPPAMHRFHRLHPGIRLALTIGNTAQVAEATHDGSADIGFIEGTIDDPLLEGHSVPGDRLALVVGLDHPWARRDAVEPGELTASDWVLREPGSGTRAMFEAALVGFGIRPAALRVALELPSNEAVRAAVEAGAGATVISELVVAPSLRAGTLRRPALPLLARRFLVLRHRERYVSNAARAFLGTIGVAAPAAAGSDGTAHSNR